MELSQEAHHLIVRHVRSRKDLVTLSIVSKRFQKEAERALYDTLHLRGYRHTISMCRLLAITPRLSSLVDALSLYVTDDNDDDDDDDEDESNELVEDSSMPIDYWDAVAATLRVTTKLRFLSIHFEQTGDTSQARVLENCTFQLHTFHCDFEWNTHLAAFLDTQTELSDLYLADFRSDLSEAIISSNPTTLSKLSILECAFTEAIGAFVPGRPVLRVKTCFSRTDIVEKRAELRDLHAKLKLSRKPLRALDLADESYTPEFSLEFLDMTVTTFSSLSNLRYLGTLVLPVDSKQRLGFYARLMNLPRLQCIEVDVSEWDPAPMTPAALRALMFELRIYCPTVARVIFVYDFDRVVMKVVDSRCVLDSDAAADTLWREV